MKEIQNYAAAKYGSQEFSKVEEGIYQTKVDGENLYLTSLSFVQEPEWGEGSNASDISQFPLEDLLDKYCCHVADFYEELNSADSFICYLEFASQDLGDVRKLREIIGKHVYNKETDGCIRLIFE